jgi:hypothetical protein
MKSDNVTDGILPHFAYLSQLLLEIDQDNRFYCGMEAGNERRKKHARKLMESDPLLSKDLIDTNVIESVSGIFNVYATNQKGDMSTGNSIGKPELKKKQEKMIKKFAKWKIDLKWVVLFPHVDDFNARHSGQNFLGSVSRTIWLDRSRSHRVDML